MNFSTSKFTYLRVGLYTFAAILILSVLVMVGSIVAMATASNSAELGFQIFAFVCLLVSIALVAMLTRFTYSLYRSVYPMESVVGLGTDMPRRT